MREHHLTFSFDCTWEIPSPLGHSSCAIRPALSRVTQDGGLKHWCQLIVHHLQMNKWDTLRFPSGGQALKAALCLIRKEGE